MSSSGLAKVLLIGAGGHARVCLDALHDDPGVEVVGAVSSDGHGHPDLGVPIVGEGDDLRSTAERAGATTACVCIGDNDARLRNARRWRDETGLPLADAVSRHAMVSGRATWDAGVHLLPGAVVNAGTHLGTCVVVNTNASVDHDCAVGAGTHVAPGATIAGGVTIGERVLIGLGARVLPGVWIGDDAVIGAGTVVIRDVDPGVTVVGVPARPVGQ